MSGNKVEILWSPTEDDTFITWGSAISLYQVETVQGQSATNHPHNSIKISDSHYAVHCATNSEIHFIKCAAWYPQATPRNLLAVGQANGRVVLTSFGDPGADELIGRDLVPRHQRQCTFLTWNPEDANLLAEGLEKFRNDPCIVIWDITLSHSASGDGSERSRYSSSEHGSITKPYLEIGPGETSSSFSWFPQTPRSFVTGMNNRYLRIYDLRDTTRPRLTTQQPRTVSGVCVDSLSTNRLASFGETQVAVWDTRMFDRPILTLQENKPVSKISWCPTR